MKNVPIEFTQALVAVLVVSLLVAVAAREKIKRRGIASGLAPVAPYALPFFHHTFQVIWHSNRAHDWFTELCEQHGGRPFRMRTAGRPGCTSVNTPQLFEDVLKTHFDDFEKGDGMRENLQDLLGNGIFAADGLTWFHQRKTASNLFTMRALRESMAHTVGNLLPTVHQILRHAAESQEHVDLVKLLNRFTMEAFARIGFGVELNCLDADEDHPFMAAFDSAQRIISLRFVRPAFFWKLLRWLNLGYEARLKEDIKVVNDTVFQIISRSLEQRQRCNPLCGTAKIPPGAPRKSTDIVSLFLDHVSNDEKRCVGDSSFDPIFLRDIVVNFLIAGRDTTAQAMCWFFFEIGQHPNVCQRLREELSEVLPKQSAAPTMDQVREMIYLEAVIRETLRLHPSVPANFKQARRDVVLSDGTFIPAGTSVAVSSYSLGRNCAVWGPDAKTFRPERWLDPQDPKKLIAVSAFQFTAFHAGPRMCLGMNLAMMEMKIFLSSILSQFVIQLAPGQQVTYDLSLTLPVKGTLNARVVVAQD
ncbi:hypothetical protein PINS_up010463 [Pythium insidiosum]|nr:hypothetical protein PINS_up010463 [Pythium insidiosum]